MELKLFSKINSEEENEAALARISELMDIDENLISQKELDELDFLVDIVEEFEEKHYKI